MKRESFYLWIFLLVPVFLILLRPFPVGDLSIWVALGRDSLQKRLLIRHDPYTLSATREMVYPAVLCLLYGVVFQLSNLAFVAMLHVLVPVGWVYLWLENLLPGAFYPVLFHGQWRKSVRRRAQEELRGQLPSPLFEQAENLWRGPMLGLWAVAMVGASLLFVPRPALVATLPFLWTYLLLRRAASRDFHLREILTLAAVEIIWVNLHGSFLLLPLMVIWQAGRWLGTAYWRRFGGRVLAAILLLLASLVNPFGWKMIPYVFQTSFLSRARGLDEWFPPHLFYYPFASAVFFASSLLLIASGLCWWVRLRPATFQHRARIFLQEVFFDPFFPIWLSGFFAIRNTAMAFLLVPIFFARVCRPRVESTPSQVSTSNLALDSNLGSGSAASRFINGVVVLVFVVAIVVLNPFLKVRVASWLPASVRGVFDENTSAHQVDLYLRQHQGSIFNDWLYGSDLALEQPNRYFIDTRNMIFSDEVFRQYRDFLERPEVSRGALAAYDFRYFLVSDEQRVLLAWLRASPEIQQVMKEGPVYLFERK